jgi:hypothetical protein
LDWLLCRYAALLPEAEICLGTSPEGDFCRGHAINDAFSKATNKVLLLADADTVFFAKPIQQAVEMVSNGTPWVIPYGSYYNVTQSQTWEILQRPPEQDIARPSTFIHCLPLAVSGLVVLPRDGFEAAGGFDERFRGWGYEDNAFQLALDARWGPYRRLEDAYCLHLWHEPGLQFNQPYIDDNWRIWCEYRDRPGG